MGIFSRFFGGKKPAQPTAKTRRQPTLQQLKQQEARRKQEAADEERAFQILTTGRDPKREAFDRESERRAREIAARVETEGTWTPWQSLNSSNLDRCRYLMSERLCQIIYKSGDCYEYSQVEPEIFQGLLRTHSPGAYRWYVFGDPRLGGGYFPYRKLSGGNSVSAPSPDRFSGKPFAIPPEIESILNKKNRVGPVPTSGKAASPPPSYRGPFKP